MGASYKLETFSTDYWAVLWLGLRCWILLLLQWGRWLLPAGGTTFLESSVLRESKALRAESWREVHCAMAQGGLPGVGFVGEKNATRMDAKLLLADWWWHSKRRWSRGGISWRLYLLVIQLWCSDIFLVLLARWSWKFKESSNFVSENWGLCIMACGANHICSGYQPNTQTWLSIRRDFVCIMDPDVFVGFLLRNHFLVERV